VPRVGLLIAVAVATGATTTHAVPTATSAQTPLLEVMVVDDNWAGTATVVDAGTYRPIRTIDTSPDRAERMAVSRWWAPAAIVDRGTLEHTIVDVGAKPYWATNGPAGDECWVSVSGED
jgi:hypothetical protein